MAGTTRLELATSAVTTRIPVSRARHRILWVGLWVENLFPRCPPCAVFIAPHQLGVHSLRLALRRSGNYSLTDCLSDFGPAPLRVHPGHNFLVARDPTRIDAECGNRFLASRPGTGPISSSALMSFPLGSSHNLASSRLAFRCTRICDKQEERFKMGSWSVRYLLSGGAFFFISARSSSKRGSERRDWRSRSD
jgi:hypothetical protein